MEGPTNRLQVRLWGAYSRVYDSLLDLIPYERLLELAVGRAELRAGDRVADLGCGTGNVTAAALVDEPGIQVTAVDSSGPMLARALEKFAGRTDVDVVEAEVNEWLAGAEPGSLDRILSVNVLYTFDAAARAEFWRRSLRALRPGGRMVVVTSDREGIGPVIREQLRERSFRRSITPGLAAVFALNLVIWALERRRVFTDATAGRLQEECRASGAIVVSVERCYGGPVDGVDVLLVLERPGPRSEDGAVDLRDPGPAALRLPKAPAEGARGPAVS